jgi:hypothetical protein
MVYYKITRYSLHPIIDLVLCQLRNDGKRNPTPKGVSKGVL